MKRLALRVTTVAVTAGLGLMALPATGHAAPAPGTPAVAHIGTPALHPTGGLSKATGFNQNGYNWSGYVARHRTFSSVSSSWVEPSVTCNSNNDLFAPWVGIDGYGSNTVEQTGVATDCSSGHPVYAGWYEMYPKAPVYYTNPVSAGDHITASVTRSGTTYTLKLTDVTKGWTKTTRKSLTAKNLSAEVIMESPTGKYPRFGTVHFTNTKVNGNSLASFSPVALDASNSGGYEDHTSRITNGGDFSITYLRE